MDERGVRAARYFSAEGDDEGSKPLTWLFVALAVVAALVLLMARTSPAIAGTLSGATLSSDDDDGDDDDDDGTDGDGTDGDGTDGDAAAAGDETGTDGDTGNDTVRAATVDTAAATVDTTAGTTTAGETTLGGTTATGETTVGGTTVGDETFDDTTTGDTTGDGTTIGDTTGLAEFAGLLPDDDVLGLQLNRGAAAPKAAADEVLGAGLVAAAPGDTGVLPFTGGQIATFLAAAAGLIGAGGVLAKRRRG